MKIHKSNEHALLIRSVGLKGRNYFVLSVMTFFDLLAPELVLTEQELWGTVPDQLEDPKVLDAGLAKNRGEFLVAGRCCAPRGESVSGAEVRIRVGPAEKRLYVFGARFWKSSQAISGPHTFSQMPLTWTNAFGGPEYELNPSGMGLAPVTTPDGGQLTPLPHVEDPDRLIASPKDRPHPAGVGPLDVTHPARSKLVGTYDDAWLKNRWPGFPDDLNPEFFNTALPDQRIDGFFEGGEAVVVENMHPDHVKIETTLPRIRQRCFVTRPADPENPQSEDRFIEVGAHVDTVWLFPTALKGLILHRGAVEVPDDEYADIRRIFIASESLDDEPKSPDHYYELQQKAAARPANYDPGPLKAGMAQLAAGMKKVRRIPKKLEEAKKKALGQAPKMPRTHQEIIDRAKGNIDRRVARLTELEAKSQGLAAKHGSLVPINTAMYGPLKAKLTALSGKMDALGGKLAASQAKTANIAGQINQTFKQVLSRDELKHLELEPIEVPEPEVPAGDPFHEQGFAFVVACRKHLERDHQLQGRLKDMGLDKDTVRRAWLGVNPEEQTVDGRLWGLDPDAAAPVDLRLPAGLVVPAFDGAVLTAIRVRPGEFDDAQAEVLIDGSNPAPLFLPAPSIIDGAPVIRAGDALTAWLVEQEMGDVAGVIALAEPGDDPGPAAAEALKTAAGTVALLSSGADDAARAAWTEAWPGTGVLVQEQDGSLFEAVRQGLDLRRWILTALPPDFLARHIDESELDPEAKPKAKIPAKAPTKDFQTGLGGMIQAKVPQADAIKQSAAAKQEAGLAKTAAAMGKSPERLKAGASTPDAASDPADRMAQWAADVKHKGRLPRSKWSQVDAVPGRVSALQAEVRQKMAPGMAKVAQAKAVTGALKKPEAKSPFSARHKEKLQKAGVDPDLRVTLTRQEVIDRHQAGQSLKQTILSGLDLSGLDLAGADLSGARCKKTDFSGAVLDQADLSRMAASGADFSGASLGSAILAQGVFTSANFAGAKAPEADLTQALFRRCDLSGADLSRADLNATNFQDAKLVGADLTEAKLNMTGFMRTDCSQAAFRSARMTRPTFNGAVLTGADLSGAAVEAGLFKDAAAEKSRWAGVRLERVSLLSGQLTGADFSGAVIRHSSFRDSELSGMTFNDGEMIESAVENCVLIEAAWVKVRARRCRIVKSNLERGDFRGLDLFCGSLRKSRLTGADFSHTNLYGVDFFKAVFGQVKLENANLKMTLIQGRTDLIQ